MSTDVFVLTMREFPRKFSWNCLKMLCNKPGMMSINLMQRIFTFYLSEYSRRLKLHKWLMRHIGVHTGAGGLAFIYFLRPNIISSIIVESMNRFSRPRKNRKKNWFDPSKCFFLSLVRLRFFPSWISREGGFHPSDNLKGIVIQLTNSP